MNCEQKAESERRKLSELRNNSNTVVDAYFITSCKSDGSYSAEQCTTGIVVSCHCVSEDGERLSRNYMKDLQDMDCEALRRK